MLFRSTKKNITVIPKAPMARMLMNAGAKRVSQSAIDALNDVLTEKAMTIAEKAVQIAKHSGRKTVNEGDIKLAVR